MKEEILELLEMMESVEIDVFRIVIYSDGSGNVINDCEAIILGFDNETELIQQMKKFIAKREGE